MNMTFSMKTGPDEAIRITPAHPGDSSDDRIVMSITGHGIETIVLSQDDVGRLMAGMRSVAMYAAALRFAPEATP
jgi:hypothetical protein